ncbi:MAG: FG-GAP repeat domain-containing protein [Limisphaerales bacterium]
MNLRKWIFISVPAAVAVALVVAAAVPSLRERVQSHFVLHNQEILATADGDLLGDGTSVKVIKFRNGEGIFVEILKMQANGDSTVIDRITLPDKHDGMFNYQGHVTRLAVADINNDGQMELLVPTFDNQLVPHLNVFHYNSTLGKFEPFEPPK